VKFDFTADLMGNGNRLEEAILSVYNDDADLEVSVILC